MSARAEFLQWLKSNLELNPELLEIIADAADEAYRPSFSKTVSKVAIPDQPIHGETFVEKHDGKRLRKQQELVEELMKDAEWRSIPDIKKAIGTGTETSISARLRDAEHSGRFVKQSRRQQNGLWLYRLLKA